MGMDPEFSVKAIGPRLVRAARAYRNLIAPQLDALGLVPGQDSVIEALSRARGGLAIGELAQVLAVTAATASKAVTRLSAQGFVTRSASEGARARVKLTRAGQVAAKKLVAVEADAEARLLAGLKSKSVKRLRKTLGTIEQTLAAPAKAIEEPAESPEPVAAEAEA